MAEEGKKSKPTRSKERERLLRPCFKSLFVYRVFLRFESQLSTKGNR